MLGIVRRVVVRKKQAAAVKAVDEHTLAVTVREAERVYNILVFM